MTNEELVLRYQQGDKQALELIIEQNRGIVYKLANKFYVTKNNTIDKEDLEQEGFIGLMIAAEKYKSDMENKAQFITYAVNWIYQRIYNCVVGQSSKGQGNMQFNNNCTSINLPLGEDGDMELQDTIQDTENAYENIEEQIYLKELRNELEEVMGQSNTLKEREILKFRYGWDIKPMTLNEIGELYEVTGNNIRDIQARALRKLRNNKRIKVMGYIERISDLNAKSMKCPERVVDKISFAEQYFKNIDKSSLLFGECTNECSN